MIFLFFFLFFASDCFGGFLEFNRDRMFIQYTYIAEKNANSFDPMASQTTSKICYTLGYVDSMPHILHISGV